MTQSETNSEMMDASYARTNREAAVGRVFKSRLKWVVLFPLICVSPCACVWFYSFYITDFGRMTNFTSITVPSDNSIPDSGYRLVASMDDFFADYFSLVQASNYHQQLEVLRSIGDVGYTTFNYRNRLYFVIRGYGGGTDGRFDYAVLDISSSTPRMIGKMHVCGNPKLNGDSLEFWASLDQCDFFPTGGDLSTLQMILN